MIINHGTAFQVRGPNKDQASDLVVTDDPTTLPALVDEDVTIEDMVLTYSRNAGSANDKNLAIAAGTLWPEISAVSLNPDNVSIDPAGGKASRIINPNQYGHDDLEYQIEIDNGPGGLKRYRGRSVVQGAELTAKSNVTYLPGTLGEHCQQQIEALLSGHTAGATASHQYLTANNGDPDAPSVTKNVNCFAYNLDLSAMSIIRTEHSDERYPLMLITPRHAIFNWHVGSVVGNKVTYLKQNGTYQTVTIAAHHNITPIGLDELSSRIGIDMSSVSTPIGTDIGVVTFDQDVTDVEPFEIMPKGWLRDYSPSLRQNMWSTGVTSYGSIPALAKVMHNHADAWDSWFNIQAISDHEYLGSDEYMIAVTEAEQPAITPFWNNIIPGDSSGPFFILINGRAVLVSGFGRTGTRGTPTETWAGGNEYAVYADEINEAINSMSGYPAGTTHLRHADLSNFIKFR